MLFNEEAIRELVFVSAVLAGFAFAVVVQVIALKDPRRRTSWLIGIFLLTSTLLLASTLAGSVLLIRFATLSEIVARGGPADVIADRSARLDRAGLTLLLPFTAGLAAFLAGIGLMGWLHSARVGILSVLCALVCGLAVAVILRP